MEDAPRRATLIQILILASTFEGRCFKSLNMDHLFYDLVEEIVCYLPRKDVETIGRVAKRSSQLKNWSAAAEDQLENRFLLDVHLRIKDPHNGSGGLKTHLLVKKVLPDGSEEKWNFAQWRFAWIRDVAIETWQAPLWESTDESEEAEMDKVLRIVSLPVDPGARGELYLSDQEFCPEMAECCLKILQAASKDFVKLEVALPYYDDDVPERFDDFAVDYLESGPFLEVLRYVGRSTHARKFWTAAEAQFAKTRGRRLYISLEDVFFGLRDIELIVMSWLKSAGTFEDKHISYRMTSCPATTWQGIRQRHNVVMGLRNSGYLVHPTRRSSLHFTDDSIRVVPFQPWHVEVDFKWVTSVIGDWKKGDGRYVYGEERNFTFAFESTADWTKLVEKYGPAESVTRGKRTTVSISVAHRSKTVALEVTKKAPNKFVFSVKFLDKKS
uniref:F-box domain-containing protein n=1 Tax=Steinernema glaseri TaxID=37863 RepID=A0A1I7YU78_9BILA